jgi:hypothetical protein
MNLTGPDLIDCFRKYCAKYNKLFIPDIPRQTQVADALAQYYANDNLLAAIELYIKSNSGPFLVFDFAVQSKKMVDKVIFEKEAINRFKNIVADTRKRLVEE